MNSYEDPQLSYECDQQREIDRLRAIIADALDYAENRYDTVDSDDGQPMPNDWMFIGMILEGKP